MVKSKIFKKGIPIAVSLTPAIEADIDQPRVVEDKRRLLTISALAVLVAASISIIAKFLLQLIDLITNLSFYGNLSVAHATPVDNGLGWMVILVPAAGGLIVGLMAFYGSRAIRGHGIPEAMEQILTNQSKIKPRITYLKPISSAISIGTGGPFGAEGPIIATGGALGSTLGQLMKITHHERKILLTAGATAGMSAIFGSPIAAIFLAVELLLFEFSPRSIIPVALACITGAAGHHLLFGSEPVFAIHRQIAIPSNTSLAVYSIIGIIIGLLSVLVTKIVYLIEDSFEKLPIHWMWWPAIGGLVVGIVGYFSPHTLGVGYDNITNILTGDLPIRFVLSLCVLKFLSWAVALGSGTSGGTLAPLLTIGGAAGILLGYVTTVFFPQSGIVLSLAALVGMSAMFAGASRALLTSIVFALETTGQFNALLPLLAACAASYLVSFFIMEHTIMTEKIARRGVKTPDSYEPDILEKISVEQVIQENGVVLSEDNTVQEIKEWLEKEPEYSNNYYIISDNVGEYKGILSASTIFSNLQNGNSRVGDLIRRRNISVGAGSSLRAAVELMAKENTDVLPVVSGENKNAIVGILSYREIIASYKKNMDDYVKKHPDISLKRRGLKIILRGQKLVASMRAKEKFTK